MRPVLLPRSDVDKKRAEERGVQMREGLRLAEHVDSLRQMKANEEKAFTEYQNHASSQTHEEIQTLKNERDALQREIRQQRSAWAEEKERMYGPLDTQWLLYVKTEKANIERAKGEAEGLRDSLAAQQKASEEAEIHFKSLSAETEKQKALLEKELATSSAKLAESERKLKEAQEKADGIIALANEREQESLRLKENIRQANELNALRQKELEVLEKELRKREFVIIGKELQFYSPVKKI